MSFAEPTVAEPVACCAPVDVPAAPVVVAPAPVVAEPVHIEAAAPAPAPDPAPAPAAESPWTMSGPGVDPAPAGTDLTFPGDPPPAMTGPDVTSVLSGSESAGHAAASDAPFTMTGSDVDHALAAAPTGSHDDLHFPAGREILGPLPGFDPHSGHGALNDIGSGHAGISTILDVGSTIGDQHTVAISGNINALDNSSGDNDHDGIPDFADANDISGF
jgi:hypothetical protein